MVIASEQQRGRSAPGAGASGDDRFGTLIGTDTAALQDHELPINHQVLLHPGGSSHEIWEGAAESGATAGLEVELAGPDVGNDPVTIDLLLPDRIANMPSRRQRLAGPSRHRLDRRRQHTHHPAADPCFPLGKADPSQVP